MKQNSIAVKKGEILFSEGDAPNCAYLIESGQFEIQAIQNNKSVVLGRLFERDLIGEMSVIDRAPRSTTAIAKADSVLLEISKDQLVQRIVKSDPIVQTLLLGTLKRYRVGLAKLKGDKPSVVFQDTAYFDRLSITKIKLEAELMSALAKRTLELRFQPILQVNNKTIAGYEALVRWNHPELGFVSPSEFIALAEETSLIIEVGEYVIESAIAAIKHFRAYGENPDAFMSINVSARQLSNLGLIERLVERVKESGLPSGSLQIEITEGLALVSKEVRHIINICHQHGIKVALDDFGTGFSNLNMLHDLEFDTIKIDQSFTRNMLDNTRSMTLVKNIMAMTKELGAEVLLEGIESEEMLAIAKEFHCCYAQGYFIGKPQTLEELSPSPEHLLTGT